MNEARENIRKYLDETPDKAKAESVLSDLLPSLLVSVKRLRDETKELLDLAESGTHEPIVGLKWRLRVEILENVLGDLNMMLKPFEG